MIDCFWILGWAIPIVILLSITIGWLIGFFFGIRWTKIKYGFKKQQLESKK